MDEKAKALANDIMKRCQEQGLTCREVEKALELVRMQVGEQKNNAANAAAFTAKPFKLLSKEKDAGLIEISESEIASIEAEAEAYEKFRKDFVYSIEKDESTRELTITLPLGENQLVLPEKWAVDFICRLLDQTHGWNSSQ